MMKITAPNDEYSWKSVQTTLSIFGEWKLIEPHVYLFRKTSSIEMRDIKEKLPNCKFERVSEDLWNEYED